MPTSKDRPWRHARRHKRPCPPGGRPAPVDEGRAERAREHSETLGLRGDWLAGIVLAELSRTHAAVVRKLERQPELVVGRARLESLLAEIRQVLAEGWTRIRDLVDREIEKVVRDEIHFAMALAKHGPHGVGGPPVVNRPDAHQVLAVASNSPLLGRKVTDWLDHLEARDQQLVATTIHAGVASGASGPEIASVLAGTEEGRGRDGAFYTDINGLTSLLRTIIHHAGNRTAQVTWWLNSPPIEGWQYIAVLDARTTCCCRGLHGDVFPLGQGPMPPIHHSCRCVAMPVFADS